jgi:hypothetical protein
MRALLRPASQRRPESSADQARKDARLGKHMTFKLDPNIQQVAEAYASDAVEFVRERFDFALDWSDQSIAHIESVLGVLHESLADANPSEEQVFGFAKMFGSYVGEVFRRNHGAAWGLIGSGDTAFVGLRVDGTSWQCWPWGRAQKRIVNGPEDNIWHYYQGLLEKQSGGS